ncbi:MULTISPECIES: hypothetical protein [unclassified Bradyrhizobium]|uniref:hypothetical protein n=1 Tax=unclassified Bradyrhizobium TaxID=2631580 RepID=UPI001BAB0753|nr:MULTISPECIES: hypothetical protein [unclassified Bradyrhizobium]MBR1201850.1 hypothetical protein [Bradyrhizobium sp. AUGA SZCCT0124]MBR1311581.1 hypothetical protein [Bradyrhizobium sp. AUGA SZCCT0051]MBR1338799.1 hypothetical protein [Bradyrhizobium sp. AUGA SZCCT0105]MBR1353373.1 hypothetical protein [Bradyrhizobium sp. AUGA SZCCT0045]
MEVRPLLGILMRWPGRVATQLAFESLGFSIHKEWQDRVIRFCGEQQAGVLNRYWDEVALETMQSLGKGNSDQRRFVVEPTYRSAFLDDLFAARDFVEPGFPNPPLVKSMFDRFKKFWFDAEFRAREAEVFGRLRMAEAGQFGIEPVGEFVQKSDVIPFVERYCSALAFERHRGRWRRKATCGLIFEVGIELGGNRFRLKPPLKFRIYHKDDVEYVFETEGVAVLDRLVPGVAQYFPGENATEYILGVKAQIELFSTIACSLTELE